MLGTQRIDHLAIVEIDLAARDYLLELGPGGAADDGLGADLLDQFHALAQVLDAPEGRQQHDPRPPRRPMRRLARPNPRFKLKMFRLAQHDLHRRTTCHDRL